jgi:integrase
MPRKRPTLFEVRYSAKPNRDNSWRIVGFKNGKRKQYWYKIQEVAEKAAADLNAEIAAYGTQVSLSSVDRLRAITAADRLQAYGKSIEDAVNFYIAYLDQLKASVPFSKLAAQIRDEFKRRAVNNEASSRHIETMSETLNKLEAKFANRSVATIETKELREWLLALPLAAKTRNKHRGYARQIFSLAVDYGYRLTNPLLGIKKFRERSSEENGEITILSAADTKNLFDSADSSVIPFLVLNFFCGIRRSTVERLDWSDVSVKKKHVIVPRYKGKNQKRYRVTIVKNALEWLKPYAKDSGSILVPSKAFQTVGKPSKRRTRELVVAAADTAGVTLPDNAGRHTFISMHVAYYESIDKTALEADTSAEIIKSNYLDIVTKPEATKFWAIRPKSTSKPTS